MGRIEQPATGGPAVRAVTVTAADFTTAGVGPESENVGAVALDNFIPFGVRAKLDDAFDNGSGVSLNMEVGVTGDTDYFITAFDCYTGSALEGTGWEIGTVNAALILGIPLPNSQIVAAFTAGADELANFTNGSVTIEVWGWELPDAK